MIGLVIIPFLIIILFASFRFWSITTRNIDSEKHWEEEHSNKQLEALKKVSQNDKTDSQPS
jgi:hypothetical protein